MTIAHTHVTRHWAVLIRQSDHPTGGACRAGPVAKLIETTLAMGPLGQWPLCQMARPPLLFEDGPLTAHRIMAAIRQKTLVKQRRRSRDTWCNSVTAGMDADFSLKAFPAQRRGISHLPTKKKVDVGSRFMSQADLKYGHWMAEFCTVYL